MTFIITFFSASLLFLFYFSLFTNPHVFIFNTKKPPLNIGGFNYIGLKRPNASLIPGQYILVWTIVYVHCSQRLMCWV